MRPSERTFLAECYLLGIDPGRVADAGIRARAAADARTASGDDVVYLGATLVAADEVVFHAFRSSDAATVEAVCRSADLAFERVVESVEVPAPGSIGNGSVLPGAGDQ